MAFDLIRRISSTLLTFIAMVWLAGGANAQNIVVDAAPSHAVNAFSPFRSLGAGVDRLGTGSTDHVLTDPILKEVLSAGWQAVTYRQNTELHVEAWHWNPDGIWSNPKSRKDISPAAPSPPAR